MEELVHLSPKEQWQLLDEQSQRYAERTVSALKAKQDRGEKLTTAEEFEPREFLH